MKDLEISINYVNKYYDPEYNSDWFRFIRKSALK